jgi:hypothetical protein
MRQSSRLKLHTLSSESVHPQWGGKAPSIPLPLRVKTGERSDIHAYDATEPPRHGASRSAKCRSPILVRWGSNTVSVLRASDGGGESNIAAGANSFVACYWATFPSGSTRRANHASPFIRRTAATRRCTMRGATRLPSLPWRGSAPVWLCPERRAHC